MSSLNHAASTCIAATSLILYSPCLPARSHHLGQADRIPLVHHYAHLRACQPKGSRQTSLYSIGGDSNIYPCAASSSSLLYMAY